MTQEWLGLLLNLIFEILWQFTMKSNTYVFCQEGDNFELDNQRVQHMQFWGRVKFLLKRG